MKYWVFESQSKVFDQNTRFLTCNTGYFKYMLQLPILHESEQLVRFHKWYELRNRQVITQISLYLIHTVVYQTRSCFLLYLLFCLFGLFRYFLTDFYVFMNLINKQTIKEFTDRFAAIATLKLSEIIKHFLAKMDITDCGKGVLTNFTKFKAKHLCRSLFIN